MYWVDYSFVSFLWHDLDLSAANALVHVFCCGLYRRDDPLAAAIRRPHILLIYLRLTRGHFDSRTYHRRRYTFLTYLSTSLICRSARQRRSQHLANGTVSLPSSRSSKHEFLDSEGGSQKATLVVVVAEPVISSVKILKAFLIRSGAQRNFDYTFLLTFPTHLLSRFIFLDFKINF